MDDSQYGGGAYGSGNYGDTAPIPPPPDPCAQQNADLAEAKALCQQQILQWRSEKPQKSWTWIYKQPAAKAYYGPLGGK